MRRLVDDAVTASARAAVDLALDDRSRAAAVVHLARTLHRAGRATEAGHSAAVAAELFEALGDARHAARAARLQADALAATGRHAEALGRLRIARRVFVAEDPTGADAAGCEAAAAFSLRAIGRVADARAALERGRAAYVVGGMPVRAAKCDVDLAVLDHAEGRLQAAADRLVSARAVFLAHRQAELAATCDFDLGVALLDSGAAEDAIERCLQARSIFAERNREGDEAACDLNLGVALQAVGRTEEARRALERARDAFAGLGRERDAAQADHDLDVLDGLVAPDTAEMSVLRAIGEVPGDDSAIGGDRDAPSWPARDAPADR